MFLEWSLIISIDRDSVLSQLILRSSRINIALQPPLQFLLIWNTGLYPSGSNKEFFPRLLSLVHVSEKTAPFLYPLKTSENPKVENEYIGNEWVNELQNSWKISKLSFMFLMFKLRTEKFFEENVSIYC